jgi:hypothetical protein
MDVSIKDKMGQTRLQLQFLHFFFFTKRDHIERHKGQVRRHYTDNVTTSFSCTVHTRGVSRIDIMRQPTLQLQFIHFFS